MRRAAAAWLARLDALLDRQHVLLTAGRFAELAGLEPAMQSALSSVARSGLTAEDASRLTQLTQRAGHHGRLLRAALKGFSDARNVGTTEAVTDMGGYDRHGQPGPSSRPRPTFEKRS